MNFRALEKSISVLEKSWKFVSVKGVRTLLLVPLSHTYLRKSCSHFHVVLINKLIQPKRVSIRNIIIKVLLNT